MWGIGEQTTAYLTRFSIRTALDFARRDEQWVRKHVTKPHVGIWHELRGEAVLALETSEKHDYQSISKTKTFTPPTSDRDFLLAQLSKNIENACIKARRYHLEAKRVLFLLRTQDYRHTGFEIKLSRPTSLPSEIVRVVQEHFDVVYRPNILYRLTGVVLSGLQGEVNAQPDLFGEALRAERSRHIFEAVDQIDTKYGKHTVFLGSSFLALRGAQHTGDRAERPCREGMRFKGEGERQRLGIPMLGEVG